MVAGPSGDDASQIPRVPMMKHSRDTHDRAAPSRLHQAVSVMLRAHGLDVAGYDAAFLEKTVEERRAATGTGTPESYVQLLEDSRAEGERLFQALRVIYSEFFRNPLTWAALERLVLPGLADALVRSGRSELRIWSAGCAAGQEAYSVAMLLDAMRSSPDGPVPYRVFATDRSPESLARAPSGTYGAAALGNVPLKHLRGSFTREGESYTVVPRIRERVSFSAHDLLEAGTATPPASIYGDFDLVLCCNVLLYYRPESRRAILERLHGAVAAGGFLVTDDTEATMAADAGGFLMMDAPAPIFRRFDGNHLA